MNTQDTIFPLLGPAVAISKSRRARAGTSKQEKAMSSTTITQYAARLSAGVLAAGMLLGLAAPASAATPAHPAAQASSPALDNYGPDCAGAPTPYGLIGGTWNRTDVKPGIGCATEPEHSVPGRNGRIQSFQNGQIAWTPDQGPKMTIWSITNRNHVFVRWNSNDPGWSYDYYLLRHDLNGQNLEQKEISGRIEGWWGYDNLGPGNHTFIVEGHSGGGYHHGWTFPVTANIQPVIAPPPPPPPAPSPRPTRRLGKAVPPEEQELFRLINDARAHPQNYPPHGNAQRASMNSCANPFKGSSELRTTAYHHDAFLATHPEEWMYGTTGDIPNDIPNTHTGPDGKPVWAAGEPMDQAGYHSARYEIVAWGQATPAEVIRAWMQDDEHSQWGHRNIILNCTIQWLGVNHRQGGPVRHYWTGDMGNL
jgi:hypothetical protein